MHKAIAHHRSISQVHNLHYQSPCRCRSPCLHVSITSRASPPGAGHLCMYCTVCVLVYASHMSPHLCLSCPSTGGSMACSRTAPRLKHMGLFGFSTQTCSGIKVAMRCGASTTQHNCGDSQYHMLLNSPQLIHDSLALNSRGQRANNQQHTPRRGLQGLCRSASRSSSPRHVQTGLSRDNEMAYPPDARGRRRIEGRRATWKMSGRPARVCT